MVREECIDKKGIPCKTCRSLEGSAFRQQHKDQGHRRRFYSGQDPGCRLWSRTRESSEGAGGVSGWQPGTACWWWGTRSSSSSTTTPTSPGRCWNTAPPWLRAQGRIKHRKTPLAFCKSRRRFYSGQDLDVDLVDPGEGVHNDHIRLGRLELFRGEDVAVLQPLVLLLAGEA